MPKHFQQVAVEAESSDIFNLKKSLAIVDITTWRASYRIASIDFRRVRYIFHVIQKLIRSAAEPWEKAVVALFLWERLNVSIGVFVCVHA